MPESIHWTQIPADTNGNSRYVCHYLNLLTQAERQSYFAGQYETAVKRANRIGGRKYTARSYGGGIVFQTTNPEETEREIAALLAKI